jgi:long-chain acyl-CoA synthetase
MAALRFNDLAMTATSLGDMMRRSVAQYRDKIAFLTPVKSDFEPITYGEFFDWVRAYAGVLKSQNLERGDRVAIVSENCFEWSLTDWACQCLGLVVVPLYPTLTAEQASYVVADAGVRLAVIGSNDQRLKIECVAGLSILDLKGTAGSVDTLSKDDAAALTSEHLHAEIDKTQIDDLATIIYTSGTTGQPKGAMLPHRAIVHICELVPHELPMSSSDVFLSFLPQSHVYERVAGQFLPISLGATLGFAKNLASLAGDMAKVRPTVLLCVPRFLDSFRDRVLDSVGKQKPLNRKLFGWALSQGVRKAQGRFAPLTAVLDPIVMKKIRDRMGGRVRFLVSGGAALPAHTAEFFMAAGLTVLQGYGLTETCGASFVNRPESNKYWTVGPALGVEAKIADDGEILLRGLSIMTGYYNLPEETRLAIDEDGFFHTGDIGEFEAKNLKITDRKKDLLVLGNGKNIAPQPIENKLKSSPFISEAVLLGDGMDACAALIIPNFDAVSKALRLPDGASLKGNEEAKALIKKEVDRVNKTLAGYEMVKRHAILDAPFTVESDELTPTLKVKRKVVMEKYKTLITTLR